MIWNCRSIRSWLISAACALCFGAPSALLQAQVSVNDLFFLNEQNLMSGSGGEVHLNDVLSGDDPATPGFDLDGTIADPDLGGPIPPHLIQRLDVGDRLVGIGVTVRIDGLSSGDSVFLGVGNNLKTAARAFVVTGKQPNPGGGFDFIFGPLSPTDFSAAVNEASEGAVTVPAASIPAGTMILSFDDPTPSFTLLNIPGSPGSNWVGATDGARHWNVGVADADDFWAASFPSDDLGLVPLLPPDSLIGSISFGLSLLPGSTGLTSVNPVQCMGPAGLVEVDFCLAGSVVGTFGVDTPFPIGLRTNITFHPVQEIVGACCQAAGGCIELSQFDCESAGLGVFSEVGTTCEQATCIPAVSNLALVALLLLASVAGVIVMRRRRRGHAAA